jgi:sulfide:quinone oxidoreductase
VRSAQREPWRVLIAGRGVAAVETLLALRELGSPRVRLALLSPERQFLLRPVTVAEAFDRGEARAYDLAEIVGRRADGGQIVCDPLHAVEPGEHLAITATGGRIGYDALVVAIGAIVRPVLPGALTFRGRPDVAALRRLLDDLVAGIARFVALVLPSERTWPLPPYEVALMTAAHVREHGGRAEVWLVTPEEQPLELFGPGASPAVEAMLREQGVRLRTSCAPASIRPGPGAGRRRRAVRRSSPHASPAGRSAVARPSP